MIRTDRLSNKLTDRVPDPWMDEECQEEDDEYEDCDELPVVYPLDMHDGVCPGHHILTAPNAPQTQLMRV